MVFESNAIGEYISALSNAVAMCKKDHAYIVWGINDETHEIVRTKFDFKINVKKRAFGALFSKTDYTWYCIFISWS